MDGVLLLDKPAGLTSNASLGVVKRLFDARKAGHTGTLDPFATGLLPVALGEATKFAQGLLDADKTYAAVLRLGVATTTGDPEGEVVARHAVAVTDAQVRAALAGFIGAIDQVPPMHSALKRGGRPLYEYARAGITVERPARRVRIDALDWLGRAGDDVSFRVACSKGTYVRTLAEDIGAALGCGAHLVELRRERVGDLDVGAAATVADLEARAAPARDALLLPVDTLVRAMPALVLDNESARRLRLGQSVATDAAEHPVVRVYVAGGAFLGLVRVAGGLAQPVRLLGASP